MSGRRQERAPEIIRAVRALRPAVEELERTRGDDRTATQDALEFMREANVKHGKVVGM